MFKKTIKFVIPILILTMVSFNGYCYSSNTYSEAARKFYDLGFYQGVSSYYFEPDLDALVDRETAIVFITRLAGQKESTQIYSESKINSTLRYYRDKDSISSWARKYVAYAINNQLLPNRDENEILPKEYIDGKMFIAILLKSMGYSLEGDLWEISPYINCFYGGVSASDAKVLDSKILTKNDMFDIVWKTFSVKTYDGVPYLNSIVSKNSIPRDRLINLGFKFSGSTITPPSYKKTDYSIDIIDNNSYNRTNNVVKSVIYYDDGSRYDGYLVDGQRDGEGKFERSDGFSYTGGWKKDKMSGRGTLKWANGDTYTGDLYDGNFEGSGKMTWANGDNYDGRWTNGMFNYNGRFNWANGNYYDGNWSLGQFSGNGTFSTVNVGVYVGQWANGKKNGRGKFTNTDNNVQEGIWEDDIFKGN